METKRASVLTAFTILLLEDAEDDAILMSVALQKADPDVSLHIVSDGQKGIDYISGTGDFANRTQYPFPDLIVLDLAMPKVSGIEFLKWCRQCEACDDLPIAVLTGVQEDHKEVKEAFRQGADRLFLKSVEFRELMKTARQIVEFGRGEKAKRDSKVCENCRAEPATPTKTA